MRGQSSVELLIVISIIFLVLVPVWLFVQVRSSESSAEIRVSQARFAVEKIAESAETVYVQGPPAKMTVLVTLPEQIQESHVYQNEISFTVSSLGGSSDVFWETSANLSGTLPTTQGRHAVTVEATGAGVLISGG